MASFLPGRNSKRAADPQAGIASRFAWFGKLPSAGDFVSRRMAYPVQQFWDHWCADGMDALKAGSTATGLHVWGGTPIWAYVLPAQPGVPIGQLGVFAPSCDRVGRVFPFIVAAPLVPEQQAELLDRAPMLGLAWGEVVALAQQNRLAIDAVDDELRAALANTLAGESVNDADADRTTFPPHLDDDRTTLPQALDDERTAFPQGADTSFLPWPELGRHFDLQGSESFWWSVPPASTGFQCRVHKGPLKTLHFLDLCR
jgi:type VI secretion system protein ImpM